MDFENDKPAAAERYSQFSQSDVFAEKKRI